MVVDGESEVEIGENDVDYEEDEDKDEEDRKLFLLGKMVNFMRISS